MVSRTFRQTAHQCAEVVGLFQFRLTNLDDIRKIFPHLFQKLLRYCAFTRKQTIQWV